MGKDGRYIAAYDISDDQERTRVSKVLEGYGFRVQKSLFECRLTKTNRSQLKERLENIGLQSGNVFIYRLTDHSKRVVVGRPMEYVEEDQYAFVV